MITENLTEVIKSYIKDEEIINNFQRKEDELKATYEKKLKNLSGANDCTVDEAQETFVLMSEIEAHLEKVTAAKERIKTTQLTILKFLDAVGHRKIKYTHKVNEGTKSYTFFWDNGQVSHNHKNK